MLGGNKCYFWFIWGKECLCKRWQCHGDGDDREAPSLWRTVVFLVAGSVQWGDWCGGDNEGGASKGNRADSLYFKRATLAFGQIDEWSEDASNEH